MELEILKTYIKTYLKTEFIQSFKSPIEPLYFVTENQMEDFTYTSIIEG